MGGRLTQPVPRKRTYPCPVPPCGGTRDHRQKGTAVRRSVISSAAAVLAGALLLAGCSDAGDEAAPESETASESSTESPTVAPEEQAPANAPEDVAALEGVTVAGELGSEPALDFEMPFTVNGPAAVLASSGDGAAIPEDALLVAHLMEVDGVDGELLNSTYEAAPQTILLTDLIPEIGELLAEENVGARVLFASPTADSAVLMTLEISDARPLRADGEPVEVPEGLPGVDRAENGEPSIEPVDAEAPTELVTQPVLQGEGAEVAEGDRVLVQYSGWLWDGTAFDSSWSRGGTPFPVNVGAGEVIEGWETGLVGQHVGSQVLMVIPPELGYGDQDTGTIPPGSTLIFVVDILHAG